MAGTTKGGLRAWLRLVRMPFVLTAVFDALACWWLAYGASGAAPGAVDALALLPLAGTSACLYLAGMACNDFADRARDRTLAPDRPLPSGAVSPAAAAGLILVLLAAAIALGGGPLGSRWAVLAAVGAMLLYNFAAKHALVPAALAMGSVRFANASIAVVPLVATGAASPLVLGAPLATGLYSAAITVLSTTEEVFAPGRVLAMRIMTCLAFGLVAATSWIAAGVPTLGAVIAFGVVTSTAFGRTPREGPPKRQVLEMLLGLYFLEVAIASGGAGGHLGWTLAVLAVGLVAVRLTWAMLRALAPTRPRDPVPADG